VALVVAACSATPAGSGTSSSADASPSGWPAASEPTTLLGTFDLDAYKTLFHSTFTTATVEGGLIRYVTKVDDHNIEFMVDPNDETKAIIQSTFTIDDITAFESSDTALQAWLSLTADLQPDALEWIKTHLDDYRAAPGAEMDIRERFGEVDAGFFTLVPFSFDDPDPLAPATLVGFFLEDWQKLGN